MNCGVPEVAPDPRFREPGGQATEDGFSMNLDHGPFHFGDPDEYSHGKRHLFLIAIARFVGYARLKIVVGTGTGLDRIVLGLARIECRNRRNQFHPIIVELNRSAVAGRG
jgi:hypothetical protein